MEVRRVIRPITFEAHNRYGDVVATFNARDLAEAYAERMAFLGMVVVIRPPAPVKLRRVA